MYKDCKDIDKSNLGIHHTFWKLSRTYIPICRLYKLYPPRYLYVKRGIAHGVQTHNMTKI